jgi:hypothetical protein
MDQTTTTTSGRSLWPIVTIVALAAAVAAFAIAVVGATADGDDEASLAADLVEHVDEGAYQAVVLTGGTTYYGKLAQRGETLELDDVYYLAGATEENPQGSLVKRGAEVYAPTGAMVLNPELVLQVENVGPTSVIARGIERIASGDTDS